MITKRIIQISIATLFILTSSLAFGQINVDTNKHIREWKRERERIGKVLKDEREKGYRIYVGDADKDR